MKKLSQYERKHLELAFESSRDILQLAGLQESEQSNYLCKQVIDGELTFAEAVQIVLTGRVVRLPVEK